MFVDRSAAGVELARAVKRHGLTPPLLVVGLPRGGVPVAYQVAHALRAPLDVIVVRKIGMPEQPELAVGAIAMGGVTVCEPSNVSGFAGSSQQFEALARLEQAELARRERIYRQGLPPLDLRKKTVVIVDDGIATGSTMLAGVRAARRAGASAIVVAVPVASDNGAALASVEANQLIALEIPAYLACVGEHYRNFTQVSDAEMLALLERARKEDRASPPKLRAVQ